MLITAGIEEIDTGIRKAEQEKGILLNTDERRILGDRKNIPDGKKLGFVLLLVALTDGVNSEEKQFSLRMSKEKVGVLVGTVDCIKFDCVLLEALRVGIKGEETQFQRRTDQQEKRSIGGIVATRMKGVIFVIQDCSVTSVVL